MSSKLIYSCIFILHIEDIESEFNETWKLLCFVPLSLRSYIISNKTFYNYTNGSKLFELINSNLSIQNGTVIYNQNSIFKSFLTTVKILNSTFNNLNWGDNWIRLAQTTFYLNDSTIYWLNNNLRILILHNHFS